MVWGPDILVWSPDYCTFSPCTQRTSHITALNPHTQTRIHVLVHHTTCTHAYIHTYVHTPLHTFKYTLHTHARSLVNATCYFLVRFAISMCSHHLCIMSVVPPGVKHHLSFLFTPHWAQCHPIRSLLQWVVSLSVGGHVLVCVLVCGCVFVHCVSVSVVLCVCSFLTQWYVHATMSSCLPLLIHVMFMSYIYWRVHIVIMWNLDYSIPTPISTPPTEEYIL